MPPRLSISILAGLVAAVGCGGLAGQLNSADSPARQGVGPHGGIAVAVGETAFAEIVTNDKATPVLAVYMLNPGLDQALSITPTAVELQYDPGTGPARTTLQPKPGPGVLDTNRFEATLPAGLDDRFSGTLKVTLDGQIHEVAISPF